MKAHLKNYRQSPRKVRLVANSIRGKKVDEALTQLEFIPKRASKTISKIVKSAAANAEINFKSDRKDLVIEDITVDKGIVLKRFRARAKGRAGRILRRTSNIKVKLSEAKPKRASTNSTAAKKRTSKTIRKTPVKKAPDKKVTKKVIPKKAVAKKK